MSQIYVPGDASQPRIPESFVTDDGTAIPALNEIRIIGGFTSDDSISGIQTVATPDLGKTITIELTNRFYTSTTCPNSVTTNLIESPLDIVPTAYNFEFNVAYIKSDASVAYGAKVFVSAKTVGGSASLVGSPYIIRQADSDITALNPEIGTLGDDNTFFLKINQSSGEELTVSTEGHYIKSRQ